MSDEDDGEVVIGTAAKASLTMARATASSSSRNNLPLSPILLQPELASDVNDASLMQPSQLSPPEQPSARSSKENQTPIDVPDSVSLRSVKSTRSTKSTKSTAGREHSRSATVSAARKRSDRASQSSLRLPQGVGRNTPKTPQEFYDELPPVPSLPSHFAHPSTSTMMHPPTANASSDLMHDDSMTFHGRRSSLDSSIGTYGHKTPLAWGAPSRDDMYLADRSESRTLGRSLGFDGDIPLAPQTLPPVPKVMSMDEYAARSKPRPAAKPRM